MMTKCNDKLQMIPPSTEVACLNEICHLTLKTLEGLKKLSEGLCRELLMVLGSHLDTYLQVLADVG